MLDMKEVRGVVTVRLNTFFDKSVTKRYDSDIQYETSLKRYRYKY